jgi:hypothetical protein
MTSAQLHDALKVKHLQRLTEPVGIKIEDYDIEMLPGITSLNKRLAQLTFDKKLDPRSVGHGPLFSAQVLEDQEVASAALTG